MLDVLLFVFLFRLLFISFLFVILLYVVTVILLIIVFKVDKVAIKNGGEKNTSCTFRKHRHSFNKMATLTVSRAPFGGFNFENTKR